MHKDRLGPWLRSYQRLRPLLDTPAQVRGVIGKFSHAPLIIVGLAYGAGNSAIASLTGVSLDYLFQLVGRRNMVSLLLLRFLVAFRA